MSFLPYCSCPRLLAFVGSLLVPGNKATVTGCRVSSAVDGCSFWGFCEAKGAHGSIRAMPHTGFFWGHPLAAKQVLFIFLSKASTSRPVIKANFAR